MSASAGFILRLSEARQQTFEGRRDPDEFAQAVHEFDYSRNKVLLCFIVDTEDHITHLGDGSRGLRAGEEQRRLNVAGIQPLTPLPFHEIADGLPPRLANALRKKIQSGGLLSPKVFDAVVERLRTLRPEAAVILQRFSRERRDRLDRLPLIARDNLALQKEAVATAMSIAKIPRDELTGWDYEEDENEGEVDASRGRFPSFISGLPKVRLREDQILAHDLSVFPGYNALAHADVAATAFSDGAHSLTVILANRLPLELQTGADLIYYNETFRCFLMVQYKSMEHENEADVDDEELIQEAVYRFPNAQLTEELERMDDLQDALEDQPVDEEADGFRLTTNPFFLKICPRIRFAPDDAGLSKGMYLPLDYWKRISEHPTMVGPKGGKRLSYRNVRRYMDNTQFATVVAGGWVGTHVAQSAFLEKLIRSVLENGKAVVIAIDRDGDKRHRQDAPVEEPAPVNNG